MEVADRKAKDTLVKNQAQEGESQADTGTCIEGHRANAGTGSGHGTGGYADVAWIEVYGKAVKRTTDAK